MWLTDGLDEGVDKKQLGSSFGSKGNMMNTDETYKTPIEYYLEELKSTKDEFALDSHTDSVISFDGMLVFCCIWKFLVSFYTSISLIQF